MKVKTHHMTGTPEFRAYLNAKFRCRLNPNSKHYRNYAARGIEFRFQSFDEFFAEVGLRPTPDHTLDRRVNDGHYEAGNVRWSTRSEQMLNRRPLEEWDSNSQEKVRRASRASIAHARSFH